MLNDKTGGEITSIVKGGIEQAQTNRLTVCTAYGRKAWQVSISALLVIVNASLVLGLTYYLWRIVISTS